MDPYLVLAFTSLITGLVFLFRAQWLASFPFFPLAGFFYYWPLLDFTWLGHLRGKAWRIFYSAPKGKKPKKHPKPSGRGRPRHQTRETFFARLGKGDLPFQTLPSGFRWFALALGLAAGWFGSGLIAGPTLDWARGLPLFYLSAWGLLEAFPPLSRVAPADAYPRSAPKDRTLHIGILFLLPLLWLAMELFFHLDHLRVGMGALGLSAVLIGLLRWKRRETRNHVPFPSEAKAILLLLALAALMRYPFLNHLFAGFQLDEASDALGPADVVNGDLTDPFRTAWSGSPALPYFLKAVVYKLFGVSLASSRIFSLTLSMLAIFVFYRWCRLYFGPRASWVAALLFTVSWWHLYFAFSPFSAVSTLLFELCAFYFLERAFQEGRRSHFWWAGIFLAASVMSYLPGRFVPLIALFIVLGCGLAAGGGPFLKAYARPLLLSLLTMLWFLGSFIRFCVAEPQEFFGRIQSMNIFNEVARTGHFWLPVKTTLWTLLSFFWTTGHADDRFMVLGNPLLDPFTGLLLLVGAILTLFALNKRVSWAALSGVVFGVAANALVIQGADASVDYVNPMRMFFIFPFLMLMVARACQWLLEIFAQTRPAMGVAARIFLGAGLLSALVLNANIYYFRFADQPSKWGNLGYQHVQLAKLDKVLFPTCHLVCQNDSYSSIIYFFSGIGPLQVTQVSDELPLPILNPVNRDVAVLSPPEKLLPFKEGFGRYYPHAVETQVKDPSGSVFLDLIRIPKADIEAAQKGKPLGEPLP